MLEIIRSVFEAMRDDFSKHDRLASTGFAPNPTFAEQAMRFDG